MQGGLRDRGGGGKLVPPGWEIPLLFAAGCGQRRLRYRLRYRLQPPLPRCPVPAPPGACGRGGAGLR